MYAPTKRHDGFGVQIRELFQRRSQGCRLVRVASYSHVYTSGQRDATVYLIESGLVKLMVPTLDGECCLFDVRTAGDIFGELCLSGNAVRTETAVAAQDAVLWQMPRRNFLADLKENAHLRSLALYLAIRIGEDQQMADALATENSEQRLAEILFRLGWNLGDNGSGRIYDSRRFSREDLAEMVGTTRSRISALLKKYRELGLISLSDRRHLIVREDKLSDYIAQNTFYVRSDEVQTEGRGSGKPEPMRAGLAGPRVPAAAVCHL